MTHDFVTVFTFKFIQSNTSLCSESKTPNGSSKQPSQKFNKTKKSNKELNQDVVVEEDRLDFETFYANYKEFATARKLVELIKYAILSYTHDLTNILLEQKSTKILSKLKDSSHQNYAIFELYLYPNQTKIYTFANRKKYDTFKSGLNKPSKKAKYAKIDLIDEQAEGVGVNPQSTRQMNFNNMNNLRNSNEMLQENYKLRESGQKSNNQIDKSPSQIVSL